eukprot:TRINITY_DN1924_c0_g2_i1.p1 TRINITY_DN1924_c0_g2~~TRINITY_DN1924_c0_g2_i1.p1  ORF type:complete len:2878 (+),score=898.12 TRINITY_DN1924_c0_g2_i1:103-8634(+)
MAKSPLDDTPLLGRFDSGLSASRKGSGVLRRQRRVSRHSSQTSLSSGGEAYKKPSGARVGFGGATVAELSPITDDEASPAGRRHGRRASSLSSPSFSDGGSHFGSMFWNDDFGLDGEDNGVAELPAELQQRMATLAAAPLPRLLSEPVLSGSESSEELVRELASPAQQKSPASQFCSGNSPGAAALPPALSPSRVQSGELLEEPSDNVRSLLRALQERGGDRGVVASKLPALCSLVFSSRDDADWTASNGGVAWAASALTAWIGDGELLPIICRFTERIVHRLRSFLKQAGALDPAAEDLVTAVTAALDKRERPDGRVGTSPVASTVQAAQVRSLTHVLALLSHSNLICASIVGSFSRTVTGGFSPRDAPSRGSSWRRSDAGSTRRGSDLDGTGADGPPNVLEVLFQVALEQETMTAVLSHSIQTAANVWLHCVTEGEDEVRGRLVRTDLPQVLTHALRIIADDRRNWPSFTGLLPSAACAEGIQGAPVGPLTPEVGGLTPEVPVLTPGEQPPCTNTSEERSVASPHFRSGGSEGPFVSSGSVRRISGDRRSSGGSAGSRGWRGAFDQGTPRTRRRTSGASLDRSVPAEQRWRSVKAAIKMSQRESPLGKADPVALSEPVFFMLDQVLELCEDLGDPNPLCSGDGMQHLCEALTALAHHPSGTDAVGSILRLLQHLLVSGSGSEEVHVAMQTGGAAQAVLAALAVPCDDAERQRHCIEVLLLFASNPLFHQALFGEDAWAPLAAAMAAHPKVAEIQRCGCMVLSKLTLYDIDKMILAGCVAHVVQAMRRLPGSVEVQGAALNCLQNFCIRDGGEGWRVILSAEQGGAHAEPRVPRKASLQRLRKRDLAALARSLGLTDEQDEFIEGRSGYIDWIEQHRDELARIPAEDAPTAAAAVAALGLCAVEVAASLPTPLRRCSLEPPAAPESGSPSGGAAEGAVAAAVCALASAAALELPAVSPTDPARGEPDLAVTPSVSPRPPAGPSRPPRRPSETGRPPLAPPVSPPSSQAPGLGGEGIAALLSILSRHPGNADFTKIVAGALHQLSHEELGRRYILAQDGVELLVATLGRGLQCPKIRGKCIGALQGLTMRSRGDKGRGEEAAAQVVKQKGLPALLSALELAGDARSATDCARLLAQLLRAEAHSAELFAAGKGDEAVGLLLHTVLPKYQPQDFQVQWALMAVGNLCQSPKALSAFLEYEALDTFMEIATRCASGAGPASQLAAGAAQWAGALQAVGWVLSHFATPEQPQLRAQLEQAEPVIAALEAAGEARGLLDRSQRERCAASLEFLTERKRKEEEARRKEEEERQRQAAQIAAEAERLKADRDRLQAEGQDAALRQDALDQDWAELQAMQEEVEMARAEMVDFIAEVAGGQLLVSDWADSQAAENFVAFPDQAGASPEGPTMEVPSIECLAASGSLQQTGVFGPGLAVPQAPRRVGSVNLGASARRGSNLAGHGRLGNRGVARAASVFGPGGGAPRRLSALGALGAALAVRRASAAPGGMAPPPFTVIAPSPNAEQPDRAGGGRMLAVFGAPASECGTDAGSGPPSPAAAGRPRMSLFPGAAPRPVSFTLGGGVRAELERERELRRRLEQQLQLLRELAPGLVGAALPQGRPRARSLPPSPGRLALAAAGLPSLGSAGEQPARRATRTAGAARRAKSFFGSPLAGPVLSASSLGVAPPGAGPRRLSALPASQLGRSPRVRMSVAEAAAQGRGQLAVQRAARRASAALGSPLVGSPIASSAFGLSPMSGSTARVPQMGLPDWLPELGCGEAAATQLQQRRASLLCLTPEELAQAGLSRPQRRAFLRACYQRRQQLRELPVWLRALNLCDSTLERLWLSDPSGVFIGLCRSEAQLLSAGIPQRDRVRIVAAAEEEHARRPEVDAAVQEELTTADRLVQANIELLRERAMREHAEAAWAAAEACLVGRAASLHSLTRRASLNGVQCTVSGLRVLRNGGAAVEVTTPAGKPELVLPRNLILLAEPESTQTAAAAAPEAPVAAPRASGRQQLEATEHAWSSPTVSVRDAAVATDPALSPPQPPVQPEAPRPLAARAAAAVDAPEQASCAVQTPAEWLSLPTPAASPRRQERLEGESASPVSEARPSTPAPAAAPGDALPAWAAQELALLRRQVAEGASTRRGADRAAADAQLERVRLEGRLRVADAEAGTLRQQLAAAAQWRAAAEDSLRASERRLQAATAELGARAEAAEQRADGLQLRLSELTAPSEAAQRPPEDQTELEGLRAQLAALEQMLAELPLRLPGGADPAEQSAELSAAERRCAEQRALTAAAQAEVARLQRELECAGAEGEAAAARADVEGQLEALERATRSAEAAAAAAHRRAEEAEAATAAQAVELAAGRRAQEQLERMLAEAKQREGSSEEAAAARRKRQGGLSRLETRIQQVEAEARAAHRRCEALEADAVEDRLRLNVERRRLSAAEQRRSVAEERASWLELRAQRAERELDRERRRGEAARRNLQGQIDHLQVICDAERSARGRADSRSAQECGTYRAAADELRSLCARFSQAEAKRCQEVAALRAAAAAARSERNAARAELGTLRRELAALRVRAAADSRRSPSPQPAPELATPAAAPRITQLRHRDMPRTPAPIVAPRTAAVAAVLPGSAVTAPVAPSARPVPARRRPQQGQPAAALKRGDPRRQRKAKADAAASRSIAVRQEHTLWVSGGLSALSDAQEAAAPLAATAPAPRPHQLSPGQLSQLVADGRAALLGADAALQRPAAAAATLSAPVTAASSSSQLTARSATDGSGASPPYAGGRSGAASGDSAGEGDMSMDPSPATGSPVVSARQEADSERRRSASSSSESLLGRTQPAAPPEAGGGVD